MIRLGFLCRVEVLHQCFAHIGTYLVEQFRGANPHLRALGSQSRTNRRFSLHSKRRSALCAASRSANSGRAELLDELRCGRIAREVAAPARRGIAAAGRAGHGPPAADGREHEPARQRDRLQLIEEHALDDRLSRGHCDRPGDATATRRPPTDERRRHGRRRESGREHRRGRQSASRQERPRASASHPQAGWRASPRGCRVPPPPASATARGARRARSLRGSAREAGQFLVDDRGQFVIRSASRASRADCCVPVVRLPVSRCFCVAGRA